MRMRLGSGNKTVIKARCAVTFAADSFATSKAAVEEAGWPSMQVHNRIKAPTQEPEGNGKLRIDVHKLSTSAFALKQSAKRGSTRIVIRKPGNSSLTAWIGEVNSRQSPIERRRMNKIRAFGGRRWNRSFCLDTLLFNFRFADQHHGDVVANRIDAVALRTFQALAALGQID